MWSQAGLNPDENSEDRAVLRQQFFFFDPENPDRGGIFNPQRVPELEQEALRQAETKLAFDKNAFTVVFGEEIAQKQFVPQQEAIADWRKQLNTPSASE